MSAQDKTEAPTPKRLEEARSRGEVARSPEINSAVALVGGFLALQYFGSGAYARLRWLLQDSFARLATHEVTPSSVHAYGLSLALLFLAVMAPLLVILPLAGVLSSLGQVGFLFSTKLLRPDFKRINPAKGLQRIFSSRSLMELAKSFLKMAIVGWIVYDAYQSAYPRLVAMAGAALEETVRLLVGTALEIGIKAGLGLLVLAVVDYGYQRRQFLKNLRMTRQEIREEMKQSEGSPEVRSRIRQRQRKLASSRMMSAVPAARVVLTNPTHYAVAIAYQPEQMRAPRVVAKGQGLVAARIKALASESGVPVVENKPLAQALYRSVEIGMEIPHDLYQAVAEVLAFIFTLKRTRL